MLLAVVPVVAAACGGGGSDETGAAANDTEVTIESDDEPNGNATSTEDGAEQPQAVAEDVADATNSWTASNLGPGIKPSLALSTSGTPAVAWLTEALEGGVFYAAADNDWSVSTVIEGYFYGPIDLAFDPADTPYLVLLPYRPSQGRRLLRPRPSGLSQRAAR